MRHILLLLSLITLVACNQTEQVPENQTPPDNTEPDVETPTNTVNKVSFDYIQSNVFNAYCLDCHASFSSGNLSLASANSYNSLVDIPSRSSPNIIRVSPGDPDNSFLIQKLEGTANGSRMPQGRPALSKTLIDEIRLWIKDGASRTGGLSKPNNSAYFILKSVWPSDGANLLEAPEYVQLTFSREIDMSYLHTLSLVLIDEVENSVELDLNLSLSTPDTLIADLSDLQIGSGNYQLTLTADDENILRDINGDALKVNSGNIISISNFRID